MEDKKSDWAFLERFQVENELLKIEIDENCVVFIGDSIIAGWNNTSLFDENTHFINRGINGQTTTQILHRFQQDVVDVNPKYVVVLVGTNDIAENLGRISLEEIQSNFLSMIAVAKAHKIKIVFCSILPVATYYWNPKIRPFEKIKTLNAFLASLPEDDNVFYLDFYSSLVKNDAMNELFTEDGVHPNANGYGVMSDILMQSNYL